jgi:hypothetical protein
MYTYTCTCTYTPPPCDTHRRTTIHIHGKRRGREEERTGARCCRCCRCCRGAGPHTTRECEAGASDATAIAFCMHIPLLYPTTSLGYSTTRLRYCTTGECDTGASHATVIGVCMHMPPSPDGPGGGTIVSLYPVVRQQLASDVSIRQHTSAYVSIRQHTSAYVSICQYRND